MEAFRILFGIIFGIAAVAQLVLDILEHYDKIEVKPGVDHLARLFAYGAMSLIWLRAA